ncbi:MAG: PAS domain S-box protein [Deltaproteobacteria bacterium]|nr:PAS domain S-box protein [Deltaproteobacteria bacterium]
MTPNYSLQEPREVILKRIKWLMLLRLMLATFSLGTAVLIQITKGKPYLDQYLVSLYAIIGMVYALNLLYAFLLNRVKSVRTFAYVQIFMDVLLITGLINATGGIRSVFSLFYYLSIISASIILYRKGGIIIATVSSVLYGLIVGLEYYGIFQPLYEIPDDAIYGITSLLFCVVMNVTAFYFIAMLSSFLSEQASKSDEALKIKEIDYHKLEILYRNIVESINSGLLTVDEENKITSFNRAAEDITGHNFSDVYGVNIDRVLPDLQEIGQSPGSGKKYDTMNPRFEISFKRKDGRILHLGFSKAVLKDVGGDSKGEIYVFQDLTKLKEMEEHVKLVDKLAAIGRFATGMAHEIRNPLASMSGSVQVLKDSLKLDSDNQRLMNIVLRETNRLDQLLSDFILFARPDDRRKESVELNNILDDTIQLFSYNPQYGDINVIKNLHGKIMIEADPQQIKQVFWNLFINAAQSMDHKGALVVNTEIVHQDALSKGVKSRLDTNSNEFWSHIIVSDTGRGIPEKYTDKIFDPFFTTRDRGIGLGLAIVYRIIESYRGNISVKSQENKGTSFTIYLPSISKH